MKKRLFTFMLIGTVVLATACGTKKEKKETTELADEDIEYTESYEEVQAHNQLVEAHVSAFWADDVLENYSSYDEFIPETSSQDLTKVLLSTDMEIADFKVLDMIVQDIDKNGNITFSYEERYSQDKLTPDKPLVVGLSFEGTMPNNGISYIDNNGNKRVFVLEESGKDGSIIVWEY